MNKTDCIDVTQRTRTQYILRQEQPYLHMPEWIIESESQDGCSHLLKKKHLTYDKEGNISTEEIYGADEKHAYTLYKTYNERGDLLTETNPSGDQATYIYDAHGRRTCETNFSNRLCTTTGYDLNGRKISLDENEHHRSFTYDAYNRCLSKTDPFDHTTHYIHTFSSVQESFGLATSRRSYDILGRKTEEKDANGNSTHYRYTAYGSPTEILYPDGSKESFCYNKNGFLITHTTQDGMTLTYTRDVLGRVLTKDYDGAALETFRYNAFNLLSMTNKEGHTRTYQYDRAGRKISEEFCGRITRYTYDTLGELATIQIGDLTTCYTRDLMGQIIEEQKRDAEGHLLYSVRYDYDKDGNQIAVHRNIQGRETAQTSVFDPFGRCISETDALGFTTSTLFDEKHINSAGERVLRLVTTDP